MLNTAVCVYVVCNVFCALLLAGCVSACDISHTDVRGHLNQTYGEWSVHEPVSNCAQNTKGTLPTTLIHTVESTLRAPVWYLDESCCCTLAFSRHLISWTAVIIGTISHIDTVNIHQNVMLLEFRFLFISGLYCHPWGLTERWVYTDLLWWLVNKHNYQLVFDSIVCVCDYCV